MGYFYAGTLTSMNPTPLPLRITTEGHATPGHVSVFLGDTDITSSLRGITLVGERPNGWSVLLDLLVSPEEVGIENPNVAVVGDPLGGLTANELETVITSGGMGTPVGQRLLQYLQQRRPN